MKTSDPLFKKMIGVQMANYRIHLAPDPLALYYRPSSAIFSMY